RQQLAADIAIIVNLSIEGNAVARVGRMHRLSASRAEINNGKSALPERYAACRFDPHRAGIGPAMAHALGHGFAGRAQRIGRCRRAPINHAGDAAHSNTPVDDRANCFSVTPAEVTVRSLPEIIAGANRSAAAVAAACFYHTPRRSPVFTYCHNVGGDHRREGESTFCGCKVPVTASRAALSRSGKAATSCRYGYVE